MIKYLAEVRRGGNTVLALCPWLQVYVDHKFHGIRCDLLSAEHQNKSTARQVSNLKKYVVPAVCL